ncbi:MAG: MOSC domain-containing protein [Rectinemataceae bacterium]
MNEDSAREGWFEIVSLNLSEKTGTRKRPVAVFRLEEGRGVAGDAHAGLIENRQVSFLASEEIEDASAALALAGRGQARGGGAGTERLTELKPGDFAENVTTRGVRLHELPLGTIIEMGSAVLELSKIGKECHAACEIRRLVGDCVMPRRGVFARVVKGGEVRNEDRGHYRIG